jgi:hypothetical protein
MKSIVKTAGPTNHVFVDFENVHSVDLAIFAIEAFQFTLLLGAKQKQLKVELVSELLKHAAAVRLIRLESSGKNALDFSLAFYLGQAVVGDPTGSFHIISKDKGFDPLIEHLRAKQIMAQRHDDFTSLGFLTPAAGIIKAPEPAPVSAEKIHQGATRPPKTTNDRWSELVGHLESYGPNRPSSKIKLVRDVVSYFAKQGITAAEAKGLINQLRQRGLIAIDGKGAVTYNLPAKSVERPADADRKSSATD